MTTASEHAPLEDERRFLGSPAFARLWGAQVVASTGDWLGLVAITALAESLGGDFAGASIGLVLAARIVPGFFLAPLAGVLVDRWDRRRVMVVCNVCRAGVMLSLPFVNSIAMLVLASFVLEIFTLLWAPAKEASVPHLVPRRYLATANSLSLAAAYGSFPVGAALFSVFAKVAEWLDDVNGLGLLALDRAGLAFWFNALTFLVSAAIIWRLPIPSPHRRRSDSPGPRLDLSATIRDLREGWHFIFINPVVRAVNVGLATGLIGGGMLIPLGPLFSDKVLGAGRAGYGMLVTALGVGVAMGVVLVSILQGRLPKLVTFVSTVFLAGASLIVAASMSSLGPAMLAVGLIGMCAGTVYVIGFTLLHENVADELRGRIFTALYTLVRLCLLIAMTVGPFLTEALDRISGRLVDRHLAVGGFEVALPGVRLTLWLAGAIILVAGWLAYVSLRGVRGRHGDGIRATMAAPLGDSREAGA